MLTGLAEVHLEVGADLVVLDLLAELVDPVCEVCRRGPAVGHVVLDAEVALGTARVVRCGEDDAAGGGALADNVGQGGSAHDAVDAHNQLGNLKGIHIEAGVGNGGSLEL